MRSYGHQPLRRQLVVAIFLLLIPLLLAAAWSGWSAFTERRNELGDQAAFIAGTTAAYIDRDITNLDRMAEGLASAPALTRLDAREATDLLTRAFLGRSSVLRVTLAAADGREVARVDHTSELLPAPDWAAEVEHLGHRVTLPMQHTEAGGRRYLVFAYPVKDAAGGIVG